MTEDKWKPRHVWYAYDAMALIRMLQDIAWPLGWHITLGGGVLNHGYSDKDVDIYVLPIYSQEGKLATELEILTMLVTAINPVDEYAPVCSTQTAPHECYEYSVRLNYHHKPVELFIIKRTTSHDQKTR